ncbi:MAG: hypothetical protein AAGM84_15295 [Pseudomonadota bacterium]
MRVIMICTAALALTACARAPFEEPAAPPETIVQEPAALPPGGIRPRLRPDPGATPAPQPQPSAGGALGVTIASLGDPGEPGLWLKTPLVTARQSGTVTLGAASVAVTLIPLDGPATAGSRMSLEAFQALGAPLTGLPEITVSTG